MRTRILICIVMSLGLAGCGPSAKEKSAAIAAFATVQEVFQHPRCQNCHINGDAPLQFDNGIVHAQNVQRGVDGKGAPGLPCATCHGVSNPPASYGPHAPPGAPHWQLPPADRKMAWKDLSAAAVCAMIKDPQQNGGKDLPALLKHVREDALVLWGWNPGGTRAPVPIAHAEFVARFQTWVDAEAPCPAS